MLSCNGCKIRLKIFSQTWDPFQIQVFIPAIQSRTERKECNKYQWSFKTWKLVGNDWIPAKEKKMKLDGDGWI
uniref:Uncharacterized protein n=1 Tax=Parascaris equorum TaxID=6256 RepID=A0A914S4K8_PAREQ